ncbi:MAG: class B sortase [Bacilli bacterium]|nr:class B sortase [Bacilli bacterium]
MDKIKVLLEKDKISFSYYRKPLSEKKQDLLNTNIISRNELTFTEEYVIQNAKMVRSFIKELAEDKNINSIEVKDYQLITTVLNLISDIKELKKLYITEDCDLEVHACKAIIKTNNIEYVNCYNIFYYLLLELDKYGIYVESRNEIIYISNLMNSNGLNTISKIFYKSNLEIKSPLNSHDEIDFENFLSINKYLRNINLNNFNQLDLDFIYNTLKNKHTKAININVHENVKDDKKIKILKKLHKKYKKNKIYLHLAYNDEYLKNNLFKQIILNTLKCCALLSILIVGLVFGYVFYNNYKSMQNVLNIQAKITKSVKKIETVENEDIVNNTSNMVSALTSINPKTVGWLKINNTNINYPIVKTDNNEFYLDHNFDDEKDYNGWLFMDYRNSKDSLDKNNIIYGHNRYYSKVMFGTLTELGKKSYYEDFDNNFITYNTVNGNFKWKIFSVYRIKTTSDYLKVKFKSDEAYEEFIKMITERSQIDFNTPVTAKNKILTLSTCADDYSRFVVHAVLIEQPNKAS